jgi:hypothetical protein
MLTGNGAEYSVCVCFFMLCEVYVLLSVRVPFKLVVYQFKCAVTTAIIEFIHVYPLCTN